VSSGAVVGCDVGTIAVGVGDRGIGDCVGAIGVDVIAGTVLVGGTGVACGGVAVASCVGVAANRGSGVRVGRWRAVGFGLGADCGVDVDVGGAVGRAAVVAVGSGVNEMILLGANGATTRTVTWSLLEAAFAALIVTWFVHVPVAVASNVT
jgi:hypothetical protein